MNSRPSDNRCRPLIAHVVHRLDYGGLENGVVNLINALPSDAFRHAVVCLTDYTDFRERIRVPNVPCLPLHKREGKDVDLYRRLWGTFRRLRPDIVHTRNLATLEAQVPAFLAGVPGRVHGEHGWDMGDLDGRSRKPALIRRAVRPLVNEYVALSRHIAAYLEERIGIEPERISQIYNGVDAKRFHPGTDRSWVGERFGAGEHVVIGTVGRLQPVKDQAALVRAFARLAGETGGERLRLVVVGDGPLRGDLEALARDLGVEGLCWFAGAQDDIPKLLGGMDVFCLPSLAEGISNTILEAMACGVPVVATAVGGNPELVEHEISGALIPPEDEGALAAALDTYAASPELRRRHGQAARRAVEERFTLAVMVDRYQRLYERVAATRLRGGIRSKAA